ncbi:TolC family protein [Parabacteroides bouchesdurhonensis]|uniref:TolC family protein n=1 Tax=Parabacteroides bouchesdurhonensis TaxID=1936995 RepID=UPI000E50520F|nr:TolC family protein [Parabacteroides bouchesdurhonensis]RHJ92149.1 TolC family protein [Bacteroides sp. AM07-16]
MKSFTIIFMSLLLLSTGMNAQDLSGKWTLRDCLNYALEHNIQVKKSKVSHLSGIEDTKQAKAQMFPSLSASVTQGYVNYPSSDAVSNNSYTGNYSVNANWTLFDGGRRTNAVKQQKIQNEVDELTIEQSEDDIQISLVQTYMQVLYAMEAIRINENTVEVSKAQRDRAEELLKAGSVSRVDFAQLESQYSTDKYQLVVAQTNLDNYKLQLKQLLELDINADIELAAPEITDKEVIFPLPEKQTIYNTSLAVMPEIKSSQFAIDIAELEKKKARAGYLPSLSMNAGIGTGHLSGTDYAFGSQIWNKFNESVGLTLSIPIFSNRENKTAYNKAKLAITSSQLELLNTQKELLKTVEGIYLDATSAQNQYTSASERLRYVSESYKLTEEQFFLGMKNTVELLTEKNNYLTAQQEVLQSKYMAVMSIQLLNIYQKKPVDESY